MKSEFQKVTRSTRLAKLNIFPPIVRVVGRRSFAKLTFWKTDLAILFVMTVQSNQKPSYLYFIHRMF